MNTVPTSAPMTNPSNVHSRLSPAATPKVPIISAVTCKLELNHTVNSRRGLP